MIFNVRPTNNTPLHMGLDAVEIVMSWEETFQISIPDADAMRLETPRMATDYICSRLGVEDDGQSCPTLLCFHQLRSAICQITALPRSEVRPSVPLRHFYRFTPRSRFWAALQTAVRPTSVQPPGWFSRTRTVRDVLDQMVTAQLQPGQRWTRALVRAAVRATVREYVDRRFRDDEHFIRDLGLD
jgi:hypothetical protein